MEKVRVTPWGTNAWPYEFTDSVKVTLSTPQQKGIAIRYNARWGEPGSRIAAIYQAAGRDENYTAACRSLRKRASRHHYQRGLFRPPRICAANPDVYLDQLKPLERPRPDWIWQPKTNLAFTGNPLSIRESRYDKGMGMRAPANLLYEIQPAYDRFVARAGVDDEPNKSKDLAPVLNPH